VQLLLTPQHLAYLRQKAPALTPSSVYSWTYTLKQQHPQHLLLQQQRQPAKPQAHLQLGRLLVCTLASQQWITTS
jgi:hypothetical protein